MGRLRRALSSLLGQLPEAARPVAAAMPPPGRDRGAPEGPTLVRALPVPVTDPVSFRDGLAAWRPAPLVTAASALLPRAVPVCVRRSTLPFAGSEAVAGDGWPQDLVPAAPYVDVVPGSVEYVPSPAAAGDGTSAPARAGALPAARPGGGNPVRAALRSVGDRLRRRDVPRSGAGAADRPTTGGRRPRGFPRVVQAPVPDAPAPPAHRPVGRGAPRKRRILPPAWFPPSTRRPRPAAPGPVPPEPARPASSGRAAPPRPVSPVLPERNPAVRSTVAGPTEPPSTLGQASGPAQPITPRPVTSPPGGGARSARPRADGREREGPDPGLPLAPVAGPRPVRGADTVRTAAPEPPPTGSLPPSQERAPAPGTRPAPLPVPPAVRSGGAPPTDAPTPRRPQPPRNRPADREHGPGRDLTGRPSLPPGAAAAVGAPMDRLPLTAVPFSPARTAHQPPATDAPWQHLTGDTRSDAPPSPPDRQPYAVPGPVPFHAAAAAHPTAMVGPPPGHVPMTDRPDRPDRPDPARERSPGSAPGGPPGSPSAAAPPVSGALVAEVVRRVVQVHADVLAGLSSGHGEGRRPWSVPPGGHLPWGGDRPPR
ncbi:hypothetical protein GCM10010519_10050 [Streptomyces lactacystinicus]